MKVEDHIRQCAVATPTQAVGARRKFRAALAADPALVEAARARMAKITPKVASRCWMSRRTLGVLQQAMEGLDG